MHKDLKALIHDTLTYLKEPLQTKSVIFASAEEYAFFGKKQENKKEVPLKRQETVFDLPLASQKAVEKVETQKLPKPRKDISVTEQPVTKTLIVAHSASPKDSPPQESQAAKKTLQKIAPHLKLSDEVPDDSEATRIANAWKEKILDAEVILLAFESHSDTLELLKALAKAIDQNLAKSKVISAERLEREKRWEAFLSQNPLRLIIASEGMQKFPELMRHYRSLPATGQSFLGPSPVLLLSATSVYKSLEHKALLWKTLCQMLKK